MALLDGSALSALNRGLFTGLAAGQRNRQSNAINRYRSAEAEKIELENEAIRDKLKYDDLMRDSRIQNFVLNKSKDGTSLLAFNTIKEGDFTFDPNKSDEFLLDLDTVNKFTTTYLTDRLNLPQGTTGEIIPASQIYGGTMPVPEDSVVIQVTNPDGSMGVLTENGSNADDAQVVFRTKKEMAGHFNSIFNDAKDKSDLYNNLLNKQGLANLADVGTANYNTSAANAMQDAARVNSLFGQLMAEKPERTPETEEFVTNKTAYSIFKNEVLGKLKLLDRKTQGELLDAIEQSDDPLNEYQILSRIANEINKINTDINKAGETIKIAIPKIDSSFFKDFVPPSKEALQKRASTYPELLKQITDKAVQDEKKDFADAGRIFPRARSVIIRSRVKNEVEEQVKNIMDTENLTRQQAQKRLVDIFGISSKDPTEGPEGPTIKEYIDSIVDDDISIETLKTNPELAVDKAARAVSNPETRDKAIASARNFLVSNGITSQADITRLLDQTKIRNMPDPRIVKRTISALSILASLVERKDQQAYIDKIINLAETGSATQTLFQRDSNLLKIDEQNINREKLRRKRQEDSKLQDPSDLISQTGASIRRAFALEEDGNLTAEAEVETLNNLDKLFNRMFDDTGQGFRRKSNIKVADQNKFYNLVLLDLARRAVRDKEDLFPAIFKSRTLGRILKTGTNVLRGDVDLSNRLGTDLKRKIVIENGNLVFLDSDNNLTEQKLTREQVRAELSEQLATLVFDLAAANTQRIIRRNQ